jgi:hypothetical protein
VCLFPVAKPTDYFLGGFPPTPITMPVSMTASMSPLVLTAVVSNWTYFNGSDWTAYYRNTSTAGLQYPVGGAWEKLGMAAGHTGAFSVRDARQVKKSHQTIYKYFANHARETNSGDYFQNKCGKKHSSQLALI